MIVEIHNEAEAVKHGKHCGWCTAKGDYSRWYPRSKGRLFVIYKPKKRRPSYQLFLPNSGTPELRAKANKPATWKEVCESVPEMDSQKVFDSSLLKGINQGLGGDNLTLTPHEGGPQVINYIETNAPAYQCKIMYLEGSEIKELYINMEAQSVEIMDTRRYIVRSDVLDRSTGRSERLYASHEISLAELTMDTNPFHDEMIKDLKRQTIISAIRPISSMESNIHELIARNAGRNGLESLNLVISPEEMNRQYESMRNLLSYHSPNPSMEARIEGYSTIVSEFAKTPMLITKGFL